MPRAKFLPLVAAVGLFALVPLLFLPSPERVTAEPGRAAPASPDRVPAEPAPDSSAPTQERVSTAPEEDVPAAPTEPAQEEAAVPGCARLEVSVVDGRKQALPGIRVRLLAASAAPGEVTAYVQGSHGNEFRAPLSDDWGKVVLDAPAGVPLELEAWEEATGARRRLKSLEPLAKDGARAVELVLVVEDRGSFSGQIVRAEDGEPLAGAEVSVRVRGATVPGSGNKHGATTILEVTSNRQGWFQVQFDRSRDPWLRVRYSGREEVFVSLRSDPDQGLPPPTLRLERRVPVRVTVRDQSGQLATGARAQVRSPLPGRCIPGPDGIGEAPLRRDIPLEKGRSPWGYLSPGLATEFHVGYEELAPVRSVVLRPGEQYDIELELAARQVLRGRLVDRHDRPVVAKEMWLLRSDEPRRYLSCDRSGLVDNAITDREGRFAFQDVAPRRYLLGPAPACPPEPPSWLASSNLAEVAPVARVVRPKHGRFDEVKLVLDRGLYTTGTVVDERGITVARPSVSATPKERGGRPGVDYLHDGAFRIGPLAKGTELVTAGLRVEPGWRSTPVEVPSGAQDLELELAPLGGTIQGFLAEGPNDEPRAGWVSIHRHRDPDDPSTEQLPEPIEVPPSGEFRFERLQKGSYGLRALAEGGRLVGTQHVSLSSDTNLVREVLVRLQAPGEVGLILHGEGPFRVTARSGSSVLGVWQTEEETLQLQLPATELLLDVDDLGANLTQRRQLAPEPGSDQQLTFLF